MGGAVNIMPPIPLSPRLVSSTYPITSDLQFSITGGFPLLGGGASRSPSPAASLPLLSRAAASVSSLLLGGQSGVFSFWPIRKRVSHSLLLGRIEDQTDSHSDTPGWAPIACSVTRAHPIFSNQVLQRNPLLLQFMRPMPRKGPDA